MARIDRGYLLIADIGGYTSYLKGVELEHAHDVLADLIGVIATTLGTTWQGRFRDWASRAETHATGMREAARTWDSTDHTNAARLEKMAREGVL